MKHFKLFGIAFLGLALVVSGCGKKSSDQAGFTGVGFDSIGPTEELSQLPQASTVSQQAAVEVLPIESSPVTPPAAALQASMPITVSSVSPDSLSREQKIQTALKNAGLYSGNIDGKIGPMTKKAIETFQASNGLTVDGKVGSKTWAALEPYLTGAQTTSTITQ